MANEKHLYLTIQGHCTTPGLTNEVWQTGVRLALVFGSVDDIGTLPNSWNPIAHTINRVETNWTISGNWLAHQGSIDFDPGDYLNDQVAPAVQVWMQANRASNQIRVDQLALYPIGAPLGRAVPAPPYASGTPCLLSLTAPVMDGVTSGLLPLQNTVVASHRTSQIGRPGRGRMFLPPTGSSTAVNGLLTDSNRDAIAAAHRDFLEALAFDGPTPTDPSVRPIVTGGNFTQYAVINQVRVGNVMDTQQRRRRQLIETFANETVTY